LSRDLPNLILQSLIFILPAYTANATPVITSKLLRTSTPIDLRKNFIDGRRIFGEGKTIEGFLSGLIVGTLVGIAVSATPLNTILPQSLKLTPLKSFVLSLGALLGDLLGSFIKRRLGIPRGAPAPLLDQLDFLLVALLLYVLIFGTIDLSYIAVLVPLTVVLHIATNYIAYKLRLKPVPL